MFGLSGIKIIGLVAIALGLFGLLYLLSVLIIKAVEISDAETRRD